MRVGTHTERVQRVRAFTKHNKIFVIIAIVIIIFLISNFLFSEEDKPDAANYSSQVETSQNEISENSASHWKFYWTDLAILVVVGGFCTIKIIQERKKAREKL